MKSALKFTSLLIFFAALVLAALGCDTKKVPRVIHQAPGDTQPNFVESGELTPEALSEIDLDAYRKLLNGNSHADALYQKILEPLKPYVLNHKLVGNPTYRDHRRFGKLLNIYNAAFNKALDQNRNHEKLNKLATEYVAFVLHRCDADLKGACTYLKAFDADGRGASQIFVHQAQRYKDVFSYYRLLYAAYTLANRTKYPELEFAFLRRAHEYARLYQKGKQEPSQPFNSETLKNFARLFQNILLYYKPKDPQSKEFSQFIHAFNPWEYSRRNQDIFAESGTEMLNLAAKHYLYEDGQLNPELKKTITQMKSSKDENEPGIATILDELRADPDLVHLIRSFDIDYNFASNEYFFIVDRLFHEAFTPSDASMVWQNSKQNKKAILETMQKYIRVQLAYMIVRTNRSMKDFFNKSGQAMGTAELLTRSVDHSLSLNKEWDTLLSRVDALKELVEIHLKKHDTYSSAKDHELLSLLKNFRSLRSNVKFLAVYPNLMMTIYLMAKENFNDTIMTSYGPVKVHHEKIVKNLLDGGFKPWFNFGTDNIPLRRAEMLYVFYFALASETFSTFAKNEAIPVNETEFLRTMVQTYLNSHKIALKTDLDDFNETLKKNRGQYSRLLSICEAERSSSPSVLGSDAFGALVQASDGEYTLDSRPYSINISFSDLESYVYTGAVKQSSGLGDLGLFHKIHSDDLVKRTKKIRTQLERSFIYVENMADIMKSYFRKKGLATDVIDEVLSAEKQEVEDLKAKWAQSVYKVLQETKDCGPLIHQQEYLVQSLLLKREENHLEDVFDLLWSLEAASEEEIQSARAKISIPQVLKHKENLFYPEKYLNDGGFNRLTNNNYVYFKMDLLVRLTDYLKDVAPNVNVEKISFSAAEFYSEPAPQPIAIDRTLSRTKAKEKFISEGMAKAAHYLGQWQEGHESPEYLINRIALLAELYKLGPVGQGCSSEQAQDKTCVRVEAKDLIEEGLTISQFLSLNSFELQALQWFGVDRKYSDSFLDGLIFAPSTKRHLPPLEYVFNLVASDDGVETPPRTYFLDQARSYYDTDLSLGHFLFKPDKQVAQILRRPYVSHVEAYTQRIDRFKKELLDFQKNEVTFREFVWAQSEAVMTPMNQGEPQYVSKGLLEKTDSYIKTFHRSTEHVFAKDRSAD